MKQNSIDVPQKYKEDWDDKDFEKLWVVDMTHYCMQMRIALETVGDASLNSFKKSFNGFQEHYCFTMSLDELQENYGDYTKEDLIEFLRQIYITKA